MPLFKKFPPWLYLLLMLVSLFFAGNYGWNMLQGTSRGGEIYRIILWVILAAYWGWSYFKRGRKQ